MEATPIGTTSVWVETRRKQKFQYRVIKVSHHGRQRQRWRPLARHWWESNISPIPEGYQILHRDGNSLNDDPSNLVLTRSERFTLILAARPGSAERRRKRQAIGVVRSNQTRSHDGLSRTRPRMWYVVLPASRAIVWLPCDTAHEARHLLTPDDLTAMCRANHQRMTDHNCPQYQPGDRISVARGRQITAGSEIDGAFFGFIRLIPDNRPAPRKRGAGRDGAHSTIWHSVIRDCLCPSL